MLVVNCVQCKIYSVGSRVSVYGLRIVTPDMILRSRRETSDVLRIVSPEKILRCRRETSVMGIPDSVIQPLQKIQNFAARLVLLAPRHHHSIPLLEKLHWLPFQVRTY